MRATLRPRRRALACVAIMGAIAAGCGGGADPALDRATADVIAGRAASVAALLDEGDPCAARNEAGALVGDVERLHGEGAIPAAIAAELVDAGRTLEGSIVCEPPPEPAPAVDDEDEDDEHEDDEDEDEDDDKGKRKKGKGKEKDDD